jgi:hypothetical protein
MHWPSAGLAGWFSVVVDAAGGCQVAIADAAGMPAGPGSPTGHRVVARSG